MAKSLHRADAMQTVTTTTPALLPEQRNALQRFSRRLAASDRSLPIVAGGLGIAVGSLIGRALRPPKHHKLLKTRFASATVGRSLGAMLAGGLAIGATATGALAIGALAIGKLKIKDLDIQRLRVGSFTEGAGLPLRSATT